MAIAPAITGPNAQATVTQPSRASDPAKNGGDPANQTDVDEDQVYADIAKELEEGATDKGLWTRLYAECGGDETQTKVLYIKRRAERLIAAEYESLNAAVSDQAALLYERAQRLRMGSGEAVDNPKALELYTKAALLNHVDAQHNLSLMYRHGIGTHADWVTAYAWARLAAANGDSLANENKISLEAKLTPLARATSDEMFAKLRATVPGAIQSDVS